MDRLQTTWPAQRVVARMMGSLPMGGVVPETPVHAFAHTPAPLTFDADAPLNPRRRDIALGGLLGFVIDDVVTPAEADALVQASEHFGFRDEAPGIATPPSALGCPFAESRVSSGGVSRP